MTVDPCSVPDRPMPAGRAEVRRLAFRREILAADDGGVRGRGVPWKVTAPLVAASMLAGVLVVVAAGGGTSRNGSLAASWTAIPQSLGESDASAAFLQCQSTLAGEHWPLHVSAMTGVLAERRGHLTAVMLSGAGQYGMCVGPPDDPLFAGVGEVSAFDPAATMRLDSAAGALNGPVPFRMAYGQVAPSVAAVEIDTADGRHVDATVTGGRFFAWWPSGADPTTITASASDGRVLKTLSPAPTDRSPSPVRRPDAP